MILIVPISFIIAPFSAQTRLKYASPFWKVFASITFKLLGIKVTQIDQRPIEIQRQNNPPGLYISNHQSLMDIPLLLTKFQVPPIMKKSILYVPIFGVCAYSSGALIVNRSSKEARKKTLSKAIEVLTAGQRCLQYYPEGTRNREAKTPKSYDKIKSKLISFAYKNNINVISVSVSGTSDVFKGKKLNFGSHLGINISNYIKPSDFESEQEFIQTCWNNVENGYQDILKKMS
ncbi:MAG: 1-acyl-sn-glycerol-3-phosphate acyltransferase [Bacteriovoracaceae bacterium]|nr:1-acyl-sn-glycerol-3-phosphate acyltransferase [Bacteriovoracaceae bacterium]